MPSMIVTIKYVNPARDGYKPSIKGEDGSTFGCKDEKLALFEKGRTYKIEYSERSFNGKTYRNVESAAPVETGGHSSQTGATSGALATPPQSGSNGTYRETCAKDAERMFVCATLGALIKAGEVKNDKRQLWETTNMLRGLWNATFGDSTFHASEAHQPRTARG